MVVLLETLFGLYTKLVQELVMSNWYYMRSNFQHNFCVLVCHIPNKGTEGDCRNITHHYIQDAILIIYVLLNLACMPIPHSMSSVAFLNLFVYDVLMYN